MKYKIEMIQIVLKKKKSNFNKDIENNGYFKNLKIFTKLKHIVWSLDQSYE